MKTLTNDPSRFGGKMLAAMPGISDERFEKALIYLCAHTEEHAMGIVVNKPVGELTLPDLLHQLQIPSSIALPPDPVLYGGPVDRDRGFVLHSDDYQCDDATVIVGEGVGLTATKDVLQAIAAPGGPAHSVLALGYAGWGPGQLEEELSENVWLTIDASPSLIFSTDLAGKWARAIESLGLNLASLTSTAGRA